MAAFGRLQASADSNSSDSRCQVKAELLRLQILSARKCSKKIRGGEVIRPRSLRSPSHAKFL